MKASSIFISFLLIAALAACSGKGGQDIGSNQDEGAENTPIPTPSPEIDHLAAAQAAFTNKVWPFFKNDRCVNCHNFEERIKVGNPMSYHPNIPNPNTNLDNPNFCMGCHAQAIVGFSGWVRAPLTNRWISNDDPLRVRQLVIDLKGPLLYKHILGEGADADEFVQWAFFNAPDAPPVKSGSVPAGFITPHNNGQIPDSELMDWNAFKLAVQEWICLEAKVPGSGDLGKPNDLDCNAF